MRIPALSLLFASYFFLAGCGHPLVSQTLREPWNAGFWFWQGSSSEVLTRASLDVLYVHVGSIQKDRPFQVRKSESNQPWHAYAQIPEQMPTARQYWIVFRFEQEGVPDSEATLPLANAIARLQSDAARRHLTLAGVQLDIDSPTSKLRDYASFLHELRKKLPPGFQISITSLLDWFRTGTAIEDVVKEVDEFVPQFYDVADRDPYHEQVFLAKKIETEEWRPRFERFHKRFRIGVSTFGRARYAPIHPVSRNGYAVVSFLRDVEPADFAFNPAFTLQTARNDAGEQLLTYRASRKTQVGYNNFEVGDGVEFTIPTQEGVRAAVESARKMGNYCAGVVFFRWPTGTQGIAMAPDDVMAAADPAVRTKPSLTVQTVRGSCAAVHCMDVYLVNPPVRSPTAHQYAIRSSSPLEYFLPEGKVPVRLSDASLLDLSLPAFSGRSRMFLGRAVSLMPTEFTIQEQP